MKTVKVRGVEIGEGTPKICVPIVGKTVAEISEAAEKLTGADLAEWRLDWFDGVFDFAQVQGAAKELRRLLGQTPLLFTFRTKEEGGVRPAKREEYLELNRTLLSLDEADLLDIELSTGEEAVREMVEKGRRRGIRIVCSSHDFQETPGKEEILSRLRQMQELDADIVKMAVTPKCAGDVLTLLSATEEMAHRYADRPVITMAMGGTGLISRLCGEVFGSAVTFGTAGKASAPGQIDALRLRETLRLIHESLQDEEDL